MFFDKPETAIKMIEDNEKAWRFLQASFLVENLLLWYQNNNFKQTYKAEIQEWKSKLREFNQLSKNEFISAESSVEIPRDKRNEMINEYANTPNNTELYHKLSFNFLIRIKAIREQTEKNTSPIMLLFSTSVVDGKWNVMQQKDNVKYREKQNYNRSTQVYFKMFTDVLLQLRQRWRVTCENMMTFFFEKGLFFSASSQAKVAHWLWRYFENDLVSAIHILIPCIEEILIWVCERAWMDTISSPRHKWWLRIRDITVGKELLESNEFKEMFGEDFSYQLCFLLYDELGYNLRHRVAHWDITYEECNSWLISLSIWSLLMIASWIEIRQKPFQVQE